MSSQARNCPAARTVDGEWVISRYADVRRILHEPLATMRARGISAVWALALCAVAWLLAPAAASAATTCPTGAGLQSVTFTSTGMEQTCVIPTGVSSVSVMAVGAAGGANYNEDVSGGAGAAASGTLTVTGGETLYLEVGGVGGTADDPSGGAGGFNGGGSSVYGGGGGGASDVRTDPSSTALTSTDSRLLVAAGGGGGGADGNELEGAGERIPGGGGGAAGIAGGQGTPDTSDGIGGGMGGGAGASSSGGSGGTGGTAGLGGAAGAPGASGGLGTGGGGGGARATGGGGGGGMYGGGGGGAFGTDANDSSSGAGGGGGGSSLVPAGGSVSVNSASLPSQITISYTVPSPVVFGGGGAVPPPVCPGDHATTAYQASTPVTFSCTGTGLTYTLLTGPAHGTLGAISGATVIYAPNAGFSGSDSFQVKATNGSGESATDTITLTVSPPTAGPPSPVVGAPVVGAPVVDISAPSTRSVYRYHQRVIARYACTEAAGGPGIASCAGPAPSGDPLDTAQVGRHSFTVTAVSRDGQRSIQTVTYTVRRPSNRFTVSHVRANRDRALTLRIRLPGPGTVSLLEIWKAPKLGRFVASRDDLRARHGAAFTLTLKLDARARRVARASAEMIQIQLDVTYTPTGGRRRSTVIHRTR